MSTRTTLHDVEDHELEVGNDLWLITGTLTITVVRDRNADCDADGNRGRDVTYEDERRWMLMAAELDGVNAVPIPPEVVAAAEDWAETYEIDDYGESDPDYGESEPDYDDIGD